MGPPLRDRLCETGFVEPVLWDQLCGIGLARPALWDRLSSRSTIHLRHRDPSHSLEWALTTQQGCEFGVQSVGPALGVTLGMPAVPQSVPRGPGNDVEMNVLNLLARNAAIVL